DIDNLRKQMETIPDQTVIALYNAEFAGLKVQFDELSREYLLQQGGPTASLIKQYENELLVPLRRIRSDMLTTSFSSLPLICAAAVIESYVMAMCSWPGDRIERILDDLYKKWISEKIVEIDKAIEWRQAQLRTSYYAVHRDADRKCIEYNLANE